MRTERTKLQPDMLDRLFTDPLHRTLGELLQERQWAVDEIRRLRDEVARLSSRPVPEMNATRSARISVPDGLDDALTVRRLLRLKDVMKLVGLSRSTIYKRIADGTFPDRAHFGPRAVRWRTADILTWQTQVQGSAPPEL
jgi:prophage regulatory protein